MSLRENFCHLCNNMLITWFHEFWKYKSWIVHLVLFLSWEMKIHLEQIKTYINTIENKSGFIDSGLVKTCDEHYKLGKRIPTYRKVANSSLSRLVARFYIFRRLVKGKFDAYVLRPLAKKFQNWIVDRSTARDFTVCKFNKDISFHPLIKTHTL